MKKSISMTGTSPAETIALRQPISRRRVNSEIHDLLNQQVKSELQSFYLYTAMASYFDEQSLDGCAKWYRLQAEEELAHFWKVYDFLRDRGLNLRLPPLETPELEFESPAQAFEYGLQNEQALTQQLYELYTLANERKEYDVATFLHWFFNEQLEEEALFEGICQKFQIGADSPGSTLLFMDKELGRRSE